MAYELPANFTLVSIPVVLAYIVHMWHYLNVMMARKKYNVWYPDMYADASRMKAEDAKTFNSIQRAHQNYLEQLPITLALIVGTALFNPKLATITACIWMAGRVAYGLGYFHTPMARLPGAAVGLLCQFTLFVTIIMKVWENYM